MKKYYLTFGQRYSQETHPSGSHVHPDGYVVITAEDYDIARDIACQLYGNRWADLYPEEAFLHSDLYERGPLLNIQVPS